FGDKYLEVPNEPEALVINYYLKADAAAAKVTVKDPSGKVLRESEGPAKAGLNRVLVNLAGGGGRGAGGGAGGGRGRGGAPGGGPLAGGGSRVTGDGAGASLAQQPP